MLVSSNFVLYWLQEAPSFTSVSNIKQIQWQQGGRVYSGKTISWDIKTIRSEMTMTWTTDSVYTDNGNPRVPVWAVHTGEPNSGQVIRFRDVNNLSNIIWESAIESDVNGQIRLEIGWEDPVVQTRLKVFQTLFSDWGYSDVTKNFSGFTTIRPTVFLSRNVLPFYMFHEYKSTQDLKYIIRYLGYIITPFNYYNGPRTPFSVEDYVDAYGYCIFQTNFSGKDYNINITLRNGYLLSGILPNKAALAVIRLANGTNQIGYVPYEGLPVYSGSGMSEDLATIKRYFKTFQ